MGGSAQHEGCEFTESAAVTVGQRVEVEYGRQWGWCPGKVHSVSVEEELFKVVIPDPRPGFGDNIEYFTFRALEEEKEVRLPTTTVGETQQLTLLVSVTCFSEILRLPRALVLTVDPSCHRSFLTSTVSWFAWNDKTSFLSDVVTSVFMSVPSCGLTTIAQVPPPSLPGTRSSGRLSLCRTSTLRRQRGRT